MLEDTHCVCLLCSHIFSVISLDATYKTPFPRNNYWYEVFERVTAEPVIKQGVLLSVRSAVMVQVCITEVVGKKKRRERIKRGGEREVRKQEEKR